MSLNTRSLSASEQATIDASLSNLSDAARDIGADVTRGGGLAAEAVSGAASLAASGTSAKIVSGINGLGKVLGAAGIVIGVADLADSIYTDVRDGNTDAVNTRKVIDVLAGAGAGAYSGGLLGAQVGGLAGPVGAAVGGLLGSVIGGVAGGWSNSKIGLLSTDTAGKLVQPLLQAAAASDAGKAVGNWIDAAGTATHKVVDPVVSTLKGWASSAWGAVTSLFGSGQSTDGGSPDDSGAITPVTTTSTAGSAGQGQPVPQTS